SGNKKLLGDTMDFLVADINEHTGKMYYANPNWTPDSDDPPDCWSSNGVGPSKDAIQPPMLKDGSRQVATCAECPINERGSRISKMSGASIKACRDEKLVAIVHPQFPGMLFKFTITPGSFKNWSKHIEECKNISPGDHVGTVLTRATFQDDVNGTVMFKAVSYPDEATWNARTKALETKATDILVGRLDRPRTPALAAARPLPAQDAVGQSVALPSPSGSTPTSTQDQGFGATSAQAEPDHQKRKRRTKAEM